MASTHRPRRVRVSGRWLRRRENNRPRSRVGQYVGGMMADGTGTLERVSIDWQSPKPVRARAPADRSQREPATPSAGKPQQAAPWVVTPATPRLPPAVGAP